MCGVSLACRSLDFSNGTEVNAPADHRRELLMSHSITVLEIAGSPRAVEILAELASRLNVDSISPDNAGQAQLWLSFDAASAYDIAIAALDRTAGDWGEHITVVPPEH